MQCLFLVGVISISGFLLQDFLTSSPWNHRAAPNAKRASGGASNCGKLCGGGRHHVESAKPPTNLLIGFSFCQESRKHGHLFAKFTHQQWEYIHQSIYIIFSSTSKFMMDIPENKYEMMDALKGMHIGKHDDFHSTDLLYRIIYSHPELHRDIYPTTPPHCSRFGTCNFLAKSMTRSLSWKFWKEQNSANLQPTDNHRAISLRWDPSCETPTKNAVENNEGCVQKYGITTMSDSTWPKKWLGTRCVNCLGFTETSFCCQVVLMGCSSLSFQVR